MEKKQIFENGQVVGAFTVVQKAGIYPGNKPSSRWLVKCNVCGRYKFLNTSKVRRDKSCGCLWSGKPLPVNIDLRINLILSDYKCRAEKLGRCFELSYDQVKSLIFEPCFYCGQSINESGANSKKISHLKRLRYHGIDRINNDLGYTIDNCVTACYFCNRAKNKHSLDFFLGKCRAVAELALARSGVE